MDKKVDKYVLPPRIAIAQAEVAQASRPIIEELARRGVAVECLDDLLVPSRRPYSEAVIDVLLSWIDRTTDVSLRLSLVQFLAHPDRPYDGTRLAEAFDREENVAVRWSMANTIAVARPTGITDWLVAATQNPRHGKSREMLVLALARLAPRETALPILHSLLEEFPGHVPAAMAEIGGEEELKALKSLVERTGGWQKREILKAIKKIEKRLEKTKK